MWTFVLALTALVTDVSAQAVTFKALTQDTEPKARYPNEYEFKTIGIYGWDPKSPNPKMLWKRPKDYFTLRPKDTIRIVPAETTIETKADLEAFPAIQLSAENIAEQAAAIAENLNSGGTIWIDSSREKKVKKKEEEGGGTEMRMMPNIFGFIFVKDIYAKYPFFKKSDDAKKWYQTKMAKGKKNAMVSEMKSKLTASNHNLKKQEVKASGIGMKRMKAVAPAKKAMYEDAGDYYGYAGEYYNEDEKDYYGYAGEYYDDEDEFEDIDASRLIQYAYDMGRREGARKANRFKTRNDFYYR